MSGSMHWGSHPHGPGYQEAASVLIPPIPTGLGKCWPIHGPPYGALLKVD